MLIVLASGGEALVAERTSENNDVSSQATILQTQPNVQEIIGEKKLEKRSLLPVTNVGSYAPVLPWYRLGELSSYGLYGYGWYPGWPLLYGSHSGWYKGW
ncbi:hypothetical protein DMN91_004825 [Ooceraea biroi]|uniref:Uncharacterized protein n=1 Tax=Ooceraea biroi TaxID=2015173 RepID=A0A026W261_OOCBI|nr:hypothetical protein X777_12532 [Ooceraea biroi]RLU22547.1 hypothetical protein DMN91_004825 [Ooceraea biroi]